jgi:hypothetical protein
MRINPKALLGGLRAGLDNALGGLQGGRKSAGNPGLAAFVPSERTPGAPTPSYAGRFAAPRRDLASPAAPSLAPTSLHQPEQGIHEGPGGFKWHAPPQTPEHERPRAGDEGSGPLVRGSAIGQGPSPAATPRPARDWMTQNADLHTPSSNWITQNPGQASRGQSAQYGAPPVADQKPAPETASRGQEESGPLMRRSRIGQESSPAATHEPAPDWMTKNAAQLPSMQSAQPADSTNSAKPRWKVNFDDARPSGAVPAQAAPTPAVAAPQAPAAQPAAKAAIAPSEPEPAFDLYGTRNPAQERATRVDQANADWGKIAADDAPPSKARVTFGENTTQTFAVDHDKPMRPVKKR